MGFLDILKQGLKVAKNILENADESMKKKVSRMSDSEILKLLRENPNNKYVRNEANKRGIS